MGFDAILKYTRSSKFPVVAFVARPGFYTNFIYLAERIIESGVELSPVFIVYEDCEIKKSAYDIPVFNIETTDLSELSDIKVFVDNDTRYGLTFYYPYTSKVFCIPHAFMDAENLSDLGYEAGTFEFGDALCLPHAFSADSSPEEYENAWGNQIPPPAKPRDKMFTVIPCGYPKVDILAERIEKQKTEKDSILVAPSINIPPHPSYYKKIVQICLDTCPEYKVVFRPFPLARTIMEVVELQEMYQGNDRVIIDLSDSNIESFARAKVFITDLSLGRLTFSIATGQPHISFRPDLDSSQQLTFNEFGFCAHSEQQLVEAIKLSVKSNVLRRQVVSCRDKKVINFGKSLDIIIDSILAFAEGRKQSYWIEFERKYIQGDWENPAFWAQFLIDYQSDKNRKAFYEQCYHLANSKFPDHPFFKMPLSLVRYVVLLDHTEKKFRLLTQKEIEDLDQFPGGRPPYAAWGNLSGYNNTPKKIDFYLRDPRCVFITTLAKNEWGHELCGKKILPNNAVFKHGIEYVYNLGNYKTLLAFQIFLGQNGWK
ncbi:hypothetical protein [Maridesulfovibrio sp.]|uniref:hypothetical protein n=1 Tax=Maridesulfovibrio sp. TaxID=2795000 RepID=UPI003B007C4B